MTEIIKPTIEKIIKNCFHSRCSALGPCLDCRVEYDYQMDIWADDIYWRDRLAREAKEAAEAAEDALWAFQDGMAAHRAKHSKRRWR